MHFINQLLDNSILILPVKLRKKVLEYINDNNILKNIKIMTFNEFKKGLYFDYTEESIKATMDYLSVSYEIAKNYINTLYYIEDTIYTDEKRTLLLDLKKFLHKNNYLKVDALFKELLKTKSKVYVFGFDYINLFKKKLLNLAEEYVKFEIILKDEHDYTHKIYEFKNMNEEVSFVFESISNLIEKGVHLNKIYIANYSDDYYFSFKTLMRLTNIPVYLKSNTTLYNTAIGSYFLDNLNNNVDALLYKINKKFKCEEVLYNETILNSLKTLLNEYYWCDGDYLSIKNLILNAMKSRVIQNKHFEEEIITTSIVDNFFLDDEYVFFIGFNLGDVPKLKKDEDFLNDDIKPPCLEKTDEYNAATKNALIKALKNIKNLTITYKLGTPFKSCEKSFLVNTLGFDVERMNFAISHYSDNLNKLNLSRFLDSLIKFNKFEDSLSLLFNNYKSNYKTYSNKFSGINTDLLRKNIDNKITFSYSNLNDFYKCPFKFYVSHVLNVGSYEVKLAQFIGNAFHFVLEKCTSENFDVDFYFDKYVLEHQHDLAMTYKEKYFIESLKKEINFVVETVREQQKHSKHKEEIHEKEITIEMDRKIKTKIKGFIDKILVLDNACLIIDYKTTNSQSIDTDVLKFGLSTQLPIYLYLLKAINRDIIVAGIYIQHILDLDENYEIDKDILSSKKKKLKLDGITFNDLNLISKFDDTYEKSEVIKSLSVTKDGSLKQTKNILSIDKRDELVNLVDSLIVSAIDKVSDGEFKIAPIKIDKHADGCEFCNYKDICYRKFKDFNIQSIDAEEDFLDE